MTQRQVTLKDIFGYLMLENFIGRVCGTHIVYVVLVVLSELTVSTVDTTLGLYASRATSYYCVVQ